MNKLLAASVAALSLASTVPAQALTFNLISSGDGTAVGTQARAGFEAAASYWSSVFTDNVTVNLQIGYASLAPGVLAQAGSNRALLSMNQYYAAARADRTTGIDRNAVANLPTLSASVLSSAALGNFGAVAVTANNFANGLNANNGYTDLSTRFDNDAGVNNSTLAITKASAKALGLTTDVNGAAINYNSLDAAITFSSNFGFDFNPTDGIDSQSFDFIGVAIHEIGHTLGFTSGVDTYDARTAPGQTDATQLTQLEGFVVANSLDLYRYSADGRLDWSTQNTPYFSVDRGANQLFGDSRFSTGTRNGDGRQASHFKDSAAGVPQTGILDPTSGRGQLQEITALDLAAFDVIGWNSKVNVYASQDYRYSTVGVYRRYNGFAGAIPEPASWAMMIGGFGIVGGTLRRRKSNLRFA